MSQVSVAELDGLLLELKNLEAKIDIQKQALTELNKKYASLLYQCANYMDELGRTEYSSPHGKFQIKESWRVNMPQDDLAKQELFEHLKSRGIFDKYATVNSNSLNALYMADWREAKERGQGIEFFMPGVPAPNRELKPTFKPTKD